METFGPSVLENETPLSALYFLSRNRLISLWQALKDENDEEARQLVSKAHRLVNPLLLASALSISIVIGHDFQSLLYDYMAGLTPDFIPHLLRVPKFESEEELSRFLKLETKYVQALHLLPLQLMLPTTQAAIANRTQEPRLRHWVGFLMLSELIASQEHDEDNNLDVDSASAVKAGFFRPDPSSFLEDYWEQLKFYSPSEKREFDRYDILHVAWMVFNPIFLMHEDELAVPSYRSEDGPLQRRLRMYSRDYNSMFHNARGYYRYEFESLKGKANDVLKSNLSKEEKKLGWQTCLEEDKLKSGEIGSGILAKA